MAAQAPRRRLEATRWLLLSTLLVVACGRSGQQGGAATPVRAQEPAADPAADVITVRVAPVSIGPVSQIYSTSATLRADRQATVIARAKGVVRRLLVEEGDRVSKGQPLAHLEDDEQRIELDRTRTAFEIEQREFQRARQLVDDELLSNEDFETARRELEEAKQALARAELEMTRTVIRAPFAGQILVRHLDVGATVQDGTAVYDLADLDPLYADVNIPERHVARLAPGQKVRLVADASGETTEALIERIAPAVDPATGTVKVTLAVDDTARLRPGAFVRADIVTDTHADAMVVPRSALVAEGRRWNLFRLDPTQDKVEQVEVELGFEEGDRVEVSRVVRGGQGFGAGDRVVVVGAPALTDGAAVRVVEDGSAAGEGGAAGAPA